MILPLPLVALWPFHGLLRIAPEPSPLPLSPGRERGSGNPPGAPDAAETLLQGLRAAVRSGKRERVAPFFAKPGGGDYLFEAATRSAKLSRWGVNVFPAPPGWSATGGYWATFHTRQPIEQDHDPVYAVVATPKGLRLGEEIPEAAQGENRILSATLDVRLTPKGNRAEIRARLALAGTGPARADVLRLQDAYTMDQATLEGYSARVVRATSERVPHPGPGQLLRVGGLLIPWTTRRTKSLDLSYQDVMSRRGSKELDEDRVEEEAAYLTAWWVPSTGRLPFTTRTRVTAPKAWIVRSEGIPEIFPAGATFPPKDGEQGVAYRCDLPISFSKVIAGRYELAASLSEGGKTFRSYGFAPLDRKRAEGDVRKMAEAARFFEARLGPFPFPGYDAFDGDDYYGIESYSYTLLDPKITPWATTHEMGHTYFGGMVPCPYVRDSWNEGVTQYVDSVLFKGDSDGTLEGALRQLDNHVPLSRISIPYAEEGTTYYRGAYAMAMLAREIGEDKVLAGLRLLVAERRGMDTTWADLRPAFERASGRPLGWFWDQWISGREWPTLTLGAASTVAEGTGFRTRVAVSQTGTPKPLRLRFLVRLSGGGKTADSEVTLENATGAVEVSTAFKPSEAKLEILGYVFGKAGGAVPVVGA